MNEKLKDGQPCGHVGCLNHQSHKCEGCGRIGGYRIMRVEDHEKEVAILDSKMAELEAEICIVKGANHQLHDENDDYEKENEQLKARIADLEKNQVVWHTDMSDDLPKDGGWYLCRVKDNDAYFMEFIFYKKVHPYKNMAYWERRIDHKIIEWAELPQPPKSKEE